MLRPYRPIGGPMMREEERRIRVLVVDDHVVVRRGLTAYLAERPPFQVVGEAADGEEAVRQAQALEPDLMLVDIGMSRMDGLQVSEVMHRHAPKVRVVILSAHKRPEYVQRAMQAGVGAYLPKDTPMDQLVRVLERVCRGEVLLSPETVQSTLKQFVLPGGAPPDLNRLSRRQREVLAEVASGKSSKEIASDLGMSVRTIDTHRERLSRKLGLHGVAALTRFAVAEGLVPLE